MQIFESAKLPQGFRSEGRCFNSRFFSFFNVSETDVFNGRFKMNKHSSARKSQGKNKIK